MHEDFENIKVYRMKMMQVLDRCPLEMKVQTIKCNQHYILESSGKSRK